MCNTIIQYGLVLFTLVRPRHRVKNARIVSSWAMGFAEFENRVIYLKINLQEYYT